MLCIVSLYMPQSIYATELIYIRGAAVMLICEKCMFYVLINMMWATLRQVCGCVGKEQSNACLCFDGEALVQREPL